MLRMTSLDRPTLHRPREDSRAELPHLCICIIYLWLGGAFIVAPVACIYMTQAKAQTRDDECRKVMSLKSEV